MIAEATCSSNCRNCSTRSNCSADCSKCIANSNISSDSIDCSATCSHSSIGGNCSAVIDYSSRLQQRMQITAKPTAAIAAGASMQQLLLRLSDCNTHRLQQRLQHAPAAEAIAARTGCSGDCSDSNPRGVDCNSVDSTASNSVDQQRRLNSEIATASTATASIDYSVDCNCEIAASTATAIAAAEMAAAATCSSGDLGAIAARLAAATYSRDCRLQRRLQSCSTSSG